MIDWPQLPTTPEQEELYRQLQQVIPPDAIPPGGSTVHEDLEIYENVRRMRQANRIWRRALRLHWWRTRYWLVRGWAQLARPWDTWRAVQHTQAYTEYFRALQKYEEARARTLELEKQRREQVPPA